MTKGIIGSVLATEGLDSINDEWYLSLFTFGGEAAGASLSSGSSILPVVSVFL